MAKAACVVALTTSLAVLGQAQAASKLPLAEIKADLNGDGVADRAVLLHDPDGDDVDLAVYLSAEGKLASQPSLYKTALGWTGDMAGTTPELSVNKAGSLVVVFQNDAIGRDRWRQQFTIALRGGVLVIAGYDYEARDTLAPSHGGNCSINFLAGRGTRNGKPLKLAAAPIQLKDWNDAATPAACKFDD